MELKTLADNISKEQKVGIMAATSINPMVVNYFDINSDKNIDLKYKVLTKIMNNEELTTEERLDRRVFELLPEDITPETVFN